MITKQNCKSSNSVIRQPPFHMYDQGARNVLKTFIPKAAPCRGLTAYRLWQRHKFILSYFLTFYNKFFSIGLLIFLTFQKLSIIIKT